MPTELPPDVAEFAGRVVVFAVRGGSAVVPFPVENPTFAIRGDRLFIVGRHIVRNAARKTSVPPTTAVAWDAVQGYTIFESEEHFRRQFSASPEPKRWFKLLG